MSLVEEALVARLGSVSALTDLVGTRISPLRAPENEPVPYVVYQRIAGTREVAFGADPGMARARIQVSAWDASYSGVKAVQTQLRLALERWRGTVNGVEILDTFIETDLDDYEPEPERHGSLLDITVIYREAVA